MIDRIVVWALTLRERARSERGQDIMEYSILTGVIAVALIAALVFFTDAITAFFTDLGTWMGDNLVP